MQKVLQSKTVKFLLNAGIPEKLTKVVDAHVTLPVLDLLMRVRHHAFIGRYFAKFYILESIR